MKTVNTDRGFRIILHESYMYTDELGGYERLVQESSAVGNYEDSMDIPGSSFLWIGKNHHLDREEVAELVVELKYWLENKRLSFDDQKTKEKT